MDTLVYILKRSTEEPLVICDKVCHFPDSSEYAVPPHFLELVVSAEHLFKTHFKIDHGEKPVAKVFPNFIEFPCGTLVVIELTEHLGAINLTSSCVGARSGFFVVRQGCCAELCNYLNVGDKEVVAEKYKLATEQYLKDLGLFELLDAYRKHIK